VKPPAFPRRSLIAAGLAYGAVSAVGRPRPLFGQSIALPVALRTVSVSSGSQLVSALSGAQPGDHIALADGTYSGTFTTGASGTSGAPIVIRAASMGSATINGTLVFDHAWHTAYGVRFTGASDSGILRLWAPDCTVRRCTFNISNTNKYVSGVGITSIARRAKVEYCNFISGYFPIRVFPARASDNLPTIDAWIHHNYMLNAAGNACEIGSHWYHAATNVNILLEYNLVENCGNNTAFGCKTSNVTYFKNTVLNCGDNRVMQCRHGNDCRFVANALINSAGIMVRGERHLVIGNYRTGIPNGNWTEHTAPTGTMRMAEFVTGNFSGTQHPTGDNCLFIENLPRARIGGGSSVSEVLPTGNRVESAGSNWLLVSGRHLDTTTTTSVSRSVPAYVILKSSDVGPLAG
jgi:hypothetical protein